MTRCPLVSAVALLMLLGPLALAEDAPRAPRSVRRAARQAEREARQAERAARRPASAQLSLGLEAAGKHVSPGSPIAARPPLALSTDRVVVTSNQFQEDPAAPASLRGDVFSHADDANPVVAVGAIVQCEEFVGRLPPRNIPAPVSVSEPVVISDGVAGVVLPPPRRLDPAILQASFEQLPVAVPGGIVHGAEAPPPLPPRSTALEAAVAHPIQDERDLHRGCGGDFDDRSGLMSVTDEMRRIAKVLEQPIALHFFNTALHEVMRHVAVTAGINVVIETAALTDEGLAEDCPVSINVEGVELKHALDLMLNSHNLAWLVEDEVLKITSRQRQEGELYSCVYPIGDLIRGAFGRDPSGTPDFEPVMDLIRNTIRPDSWSEFGGRGSMAAHAGSRSLVIRQARRVHDEIASLLEQVRQLTIAGAAQSDSISQLSAETFDLSPPIAPSPNIGSQVVAFHPRNANALSRSCSLHFDEAPLRDVLRQLADEYGISFSVDLAGLYAEGLTPEVPVSVQVEGLKISSVLNLILKPRKLDYLYQNGTVCITTRQHKQRHLFARCYSIGDLVQPVLSGTTEALTNGGAVTGFGQTDPQSLIELITSLIDPVGWAEFGGQGTIRLDESKRGLIVRQTSAVHDEIAEFLAGLRELSELQIDLDVKAVRISHAEYEKLTSVYSSAWEDNRAFLNTPQRLRLEKLLADEYQATEVASCHVTLFNGQASCVPRADSTQAPFGFIRTAATRDRRMVRLDISTPRQLTGSEALRYVTSFVIPDGKGCVINASQPSLLRSNIDGAFDPRAFDVGRAEISTEECRGVTWDPSSDGVTLVFITPRIIVREEAEERYMPVTQVSASDTADLQQSNAVIDVTRGPRFFVAEEEEVHSPPDPYPAREESRPAAPAGALPDSYDQWGVPTQDLLFEEGEDKPRLILQTP